MTLPRRAPLVGAAFIIELEDIMAPVAEPIMEPDIIEPDIIMLVPVIMAPLIMVSDMTLMVMVGMAPDIIMEEDMSAAATAETKRATTVVNCMLAVGDLKIGVLGGW